ncbi:molybdenum cofactor guanylyltransferase [Ornithinimicrobium cerasi]|uniref:molybdenum cofactor guanylyltransferase n=1 Tax=Ornithinimicrobium cerasi TaxID=2248773 RepID=UPI00137AAE2E|nr:NTP transferase domain-containing protein [Ornithinimicrobium cerasi]
MSTPTVDLLVLAGGRGERLGGHDKAALVIGGRTLLDRVLDASSLLGGGVVVVGDTPVPEGVVRTVEDPPDGGPVAGIAAGLAALAQGFPAAWVAVVAVDQPAALPALTALHAALPGLPDDVDAVSHADPGGHRQWLLAVYRRAALEAALAALPGPRHTSVRRLVADLAWHLVEQGAEHVGDVDTWAAAAEWERRLGGARMGADGRGRRPGTEEV